MTLDLRGHHEREGDQHVLVVERSLPHPIDRVWATLTESDRLERWFGTWTGDPAEGHVMMTMNAEGDENLTPIRYDITDCAPPRLVRVTSSDTFGSWDIAVDLTETPGGTIARLVQRMDDPALIAAVGPGWEYYLDRLAAALADGDPNALVWDDYESHLTPLYRAIEDVARGSSAE